MLGSLFLVIKKYDLRKFILLLIFIIFKLLVNLSWEGGAEGLLRIYTRVISGQTVYMCSLAENVQYCTCVLCSYAMICYRNLHAYPHRGRVSVVWASIQIVAGTPTSSVPWVTPYTDTEIPVTPTHPIERLIVAHELSVLISPEMTCKVNCYCHNDGNTDCDVVSGVIAFISSFASNLYDSFIMSNYNHCTLVWHVWGQVNDQELEKIHKRLLDYRLPIITPLTWRYLKQLAPPPTKHSGLVWLH